MIAHPAFSPSNDQIADRLKGRRIVVTGAASGIGRAVADVFLRAGARVAMLDRHRPAPLPGDAALSSAHEADVTDPQAIEAAIQQAVTTFGGLDGVVNAAGIGNADFADSVSLEEWKRVIDVNLTGTFNVCRAALPHLREAGTGTIVNLSSGLGLLPFKQRSAYAASKAGVIAFSRCIAMEWAPLVRVNTICPGTVDTPMVQSGYSPEVLHTQVGKRYALERIAEPQEIAMAALYLSSAESSFVTGIALAIDGGRSYH